MATSFPEEVMKLLRETRDLDEDDTSEDDDIRLMSRDEALDAICNYDGIINYGHTIRRWVMGIYGIDLSDIDRRESRIRDISNKFGGKEEDVE